MRVRAPRSTLAPGDGALRCLSHLRQSCFWVYTEPSRSQLLQKKDNQPLSLKFKDGSLHLLLFGYISDRSIPFETCGTKQTDSANVKQSPRRWPRPTCLPAAQNLQVPGAPASKDPVEGLPQTGDLLKKGGLQPPPPQKKKKNNTHTRKENARAFGVAC